MTIDERLERLTERHEALAQSLELLTHEVRETRAAAEALVVAVQAGAPSGFKDFSKSATTAGATPGYETGNTFKTSSPW